MSDIQLKWFEVEVLYMSTDKLDEDEERDNLVRRLQMKASGETMYKTDTAFFNLAVDQISQLSPAHLIDEDTKKYYTVITFESGNTVAAVGKPERIYRQLNEYVKNIT
jgi:hypothetical protein